MEVVVVEVPELGNHAHLVHDGAQALVVDPPRDWRPLELAAEEAGVRIAAVADTHVHNDYVSGAPALARRHGADYWLSADERVHVDRTGVRGRRHPRRRRPGRPGPVDARPHPAPPVVPGDRPLVRGPHRLLRRQPAARHRGPHRPGRPAAEPDDGSRPVGERPPARRARRHGRPPPDARLRQPLRCDAVPTGASTAPSATSASRNPVLVDPAGHVRRGPGRRLRSGAPLLPPHGGAQPGRRGGRAGPAARRGRRGHGARRGPRRLLGARPPPAPRVRPRPPHRLGQHRGLPAVRDVRRVAGAVGLRRRPGERLPRRPRRRGPRPRPDRRRGAGDAPPRTGRAPGSTARTTASPTGRRTRAAPAAASPSTCGSTPSTAPRTCPTRCTSRCTTSTARSPGSRPVRCGCTAGAASVPPSRPACSPARGRDVVLVTDDWDARSSRSASRPWRAARPPEPRDVVSTATTRPPPPPGVRPPVEKAVTMTTPTPSPPCVRRIRRDRGPGAAAPPPRDPGRRRPPRRGLVAAQSRPRRRGRRPGRPLPGPPRPHHPRPLLPARLGRRRPPRPGGRPSGRDRRAVLRRHAPVDTHHVDLQTTDGTTVRLLVVPPSFNDADGEESLLAASTPGNAHSAGDLLPPSPTRTASTPAATGATTGAPGGATRPPPRRAPADHACPDDRAGAWCPNGSVSAYPSAASTEGSICRRRPLVAVGARVEAVEAEHLVGVGDEERPDHVRQRHRAGAGGQRGVALGGRELA